MSMLMTGGAVGPDTILYTKPVIAWDEVEPPAASSKGV